MFRILILLLLLSSCALPVANDLQMEGLNSEEKALAYVEFGLAAYSKNKYFEALSYLRKASFLVPTYKNVRYNLALTLVKLQNYDEAKDVLVLLIEEDPKDLYKSTLAEVYLKEYDHNQALKIYLELLTKAEKSEKLNDIALYSKNIAQILFLLGDEQEALCYSQRSADYIINADIVDYISLLSALGYTKQITSRFDVLEFARQTRNADIILWYVLAYYDLNNFEQAYLLSQILEAESLSGKSTAGLHDLIALITEKYKYEKKEESGESFSPNSLIRNYWPYSVLQDLNTEG